MANQFAYASDEMVPCSNPRVLTFSQSLGLVPVSISLIVRSGDVLVSIPRFEYCPARIADIMLGFRG